MASGKDKHGQPPHAYYADRVNDRLVAELLRVCKGIIARCTRPAAARTRLK